MERILFHPGAAGKRFVMLSGICHMSGRSPRGPWKRRWSRAREVGGALLARDTMVVTNAIAFNFLLCLFPLLLVLTAAAQLPAGAAWRRCCWSWTS